MKKCKSCRKEIDPEVKICPYCRDFQKWSYYPGTYLIPLLYLYIFFTFDIFWKKNYEDYKDSFSSEFVSKVDESENYTVHTYRIINNSDIKWKDIFSQLIGYDENGKVIVVESDREYFWIISPNQSKMLSVRIRKNILVKKWQLVINDMRYERF